MAQYISVKRKQQTNKHAPLAIMLCLLFLFSSFSFSFADNYDIAPYQVPYLPSGTSIVSNGLNIDGTWYCATTTTSSAIIFATATNYANDGNYYLTFFQRVEDFNPDSNTPYALTVTNGSNPRSYFTSSSNGDDDWKYSVWSGSNRIQLNPSTTSLPVFSSVADAIATLNQLDFSGGSSGGGITNNGNAIITVNPGNVAYIGYDSATFNFLINLSKPVSSYNSNARYGFATELPSGVITFTPSSGNALPLRKSIPDLLGRSATWVGSVDTDTIGYFIVYNPVYDLNGNTNPPIKVTVTIGYMNVTQFPLSASDIGGDIISTGHSDNFYISDGVQGGTDLPSYIYSQTDQNGNVTTSSALTVPVTPYNYTTQSAGTAESGLQGFIQQILDLLAAPIKLITNLYNSAVGFFNYLSSLWSWLPPELTTIIVSALGVLVVIGVIKFLWK